MITFIIAILIASAASIGYAEEFGVARGYVPVLNIPRIKAVFTGKPGMEITTDRCGQVRELEYIAMPGTVFRLLKKHLTGGVLVYQVETEEYQASSGVQLFVDSRLIRAEKSLPQRRQLEKLSYHDIISALRQTEGKPYVWGGNSPAGVPEFAALYYESRIQSAAGGALLAGLDCSGLLYHATGGATPRNTSELVFFGEGVPIAGKSRSEIASLLRPLDLIVWKGHVIIVIDGAFTIESILKCGKPGNGGVVIRPLDQRLAEVMNLRTPADFWSKGSAGGDIFVVRRWY